MITPPSSPYANAVAPFAPLGRAPVGQENAELRLSTLKPLEQSAQPARGENRRSPDERPNEVNEQQRLRDGRVVDDEQNKQKREQQNEERKKHQEETEREVIRELAAQRDALEKAQQAEAAEHEERVQREEAVRHGQRGQDDQPDGRTTLTAGHRAHVADVTRRLADIKAFNLNSSVGRLVDDSV